MNDIHTTGLPLSITNRIRFRGAPFYRRIAFSSRGFPQQGMGFLHRIPLFPANGIRINCVTLSKENGFAPKGSTSPSECNSHQDGHPLSQTNGIRTRESPSPSEWDSHQGGHPLHSEWGSLLTSGLVATRDPFQGILLPGHASQGIPFPKGLRLYL